MQVTDDARSSPPALSNRVSSQANNSGTSVEWSHPPLVERSAEPGRDNPPATNSRALPSGTDWRKLADKEAGEYDDSALLEQQLDSLLNRADQEPDKTKRWRLLDEKVRAIYHALLESRINGNSVGPLVAAALMVLVGAILAYTHREPTHLYCAYAGCTPQIYVRVLYQFPQSHFDFRLQLVTDGVPGRPSVWHFCHDQKPLFENGFLLEKLEFADRGKCTELALFRPAYIIVRDTEGWPILPANCRQDPQNPMYGRVSCDGAPKF